MIRQFKNNQNPVLFERIFADFNTAAIPNISWLNEAFGRAYTVESKTYGGLTFVEPAVYVDNGEYLSMLPNDTYGNFSFFILDDPQTYAIQPNGRGLIEANGSIIFWFNLESVYSGDDLLKQASENIKLELIRFITTPGLIKTGRIELLRVEEKPNNVYNGYSLKNVESQYLTYPYHGFRFRCLFKVKELC